MLMEDDCYLPWNVREVPALTKNAELTASEGDPEPLRNGVDRPVGDVDNGWTCRAGSWAQYTFDGVKDVCKFRLVFDSNVNRREKNMAHSYPLDMEPATVPDVMTRAFRIETLDENGDWNVAVQVENNYQRLVLLKADVQTKAVRFIPEATWGSDQMHVFAWDVTGQ